MSGETPSKASSCFSCLLALSSLVFWSCHSRVCLPFNIAAFLSVCQIFLVSHKDSCHWIWTHRIIEDDFFISRSLILPAKTFFFFFSTKVTFTSSGDLTGMSNISWNNSTHYQIKRWLTSLVIKDIQIKMSYNLSFSLANLEKWNFNKGIGEWGLNVLLA